MTRTAPLIIASLLLVVACSDESESPDASSQPDATTPDSGPSDAGVEDDAGTPDVGVHDGGASDAGEPDAGGQDAGPPDFRIPNLTADVQVDFDEYGVLHVRCEDDLDCFAVQGYFHAAQRFPQMDIRRRFARGKLAEVFGILTLPTDRQIRTLISRRDGGRIEETLYASASQATRDMFEAYTRGVNAWIADLRAGRNGAALPPMYQAYADVITDWEPLDSAGCVLTLVQSLTDQSLTEIENGNRALQLSAEQFVDMFGLIPASPSSVLPRPITDGRESRIDVEGIRAVQTALHPFRHALARAADVARRFPVLEGLGSNNWILSGSQTANGKTLLANDPHLGLSQPAVWYLVSLNGQGAGSEIHVAGSSFAGLPGIILGQNEEIAWGATATYFDMADVYVETLNATGDAVMFDGGEVPIQQVDLTFNVRGQPPVTETFGYVPHHGPIIASDPGNNQALSIRWTAADATTDLDIIWTLMTSSSVPEARTSLRNVSTLGQNWVVIDRQDNIGWFPYNRVPNRPWNSPALPSWLPLPGDGSAEWAGTVPYEELPQSLNPSSGWLATANNDMTGHLGDGDPTNDGQDAIQHYVATGYRHERIVERIVDDLGNHTPETMQDIQADITSLLAERVLPTILSYVNPGPSGVSDAQQLINVLEEWGYTCPTGLLGNQPDSAPDPDAVVAAESIGCAAFHVLWPRIVRGAFQDELIAAGVDGNARIDAAVHLLTNPSLLVLQDTYWDDVSTASTAETPETILNMAIEDAAAWLTTNVGPSPDDWRWGRIHTVTLRPDLLSSLTDAHNVGPFANDGGLFTVDVANTSRAFNDNYEHRSGPSMRFVCESDIAAVECTIDVPGGQSAFPSSSHYDDLLMRWLANDTTAPIPLWIEPTDIDAASVETIFVRAP